jgi:phage shock protein E
MPAEIDTPLFIDVRSPGEFASGHLAGAVNLPLNQLQADIGTLVPDMATPVVLYCASGARSAFACGVLQQLGYRHVSNGGGVGLLAMQTQRAIVRC